MEGDDYGDDDDDGAWTKSQESGEEAPGKSSLIRNLNTCLTEIKFTIPKDRYEEVKTAMSNGSNCFYLVFDGNSRIVATI